MGCKGCSKRQNNKLNTYDWLCDVPDAEGSTDFVEVQFKNTRKGYYLNSAKIPLEKGDIVAVEASPGHDIGTVSLTGKLVLLQMKRTTCARKLSQNGFTERQNRPISRNMRKRKQRNMPL